MLAVGLMSGIDFEAWVNFVGWGVGSPQQTASVQDRYSPQTGQQAFL
jgi:hypothetical protein